MGIRKSIKRHSLNILRTESLRAPVWFLSHYNQSAHYAHVKAVGLIRSISVSPTWQVNPVFSCSLPSLSHGHAFISLSLLRSVPTGDQVLGSGLHSAFRTCLCFFSQLLFPFLFLRSPGSQKEDEGRISSWKSKRQKGREKVKGHRKGDSAVGCQGYRRAAD